MKEKHHIDCYKNALEKKFGRSYIFSGLAHERLIHI